MRLDMLEGNMGNPQPSP